MFKAINWATVRNSVVAGVMIFLLYEAYQVGKVRYAKWQAQRAAEKAAQPEEPATV